MRLIGAMWMLALAAGLARADDGLAARELPAAGAGETVLVCESSQLHARLTLRRGSATFVWQWQDGTAPESIEFKGIDGYYDGHMTSLFTGKRFSFAVENQFGVWRNARLIAAVGPVGSARNVVEIHFDSCLAPGDRPLPRLIPPDASEVNQ